MSRKFEPGTKVETDEGPGKIVGPWLSRGLRRHGDLEQDGWIVALDSGRRKVLPDDQIREAERPAV